MSKIMRCVQSSSAKLERKGNKDAKEVKARINMCMKFPLK
jgi:hypothetical protein